jgi:PAS domain S-box-containing protein
MRTDRPSTHSRFDELRLQARELLKRGGGLSARFSGADIISLIHELEVHQIELEIQNEELRSARIDLEQSRNRYADLYEHAPVGYLDLTTDGRIAQSNIAAKAMLGLGAQYQSKCHFSSLIYAVDQGKFWRLMNRMAKGERPQGACELRIVTVAGLRHIQIEMASSADAERKVTGWRIAFVDITERKRSEEALRKEHSFRSAIIANVADGLCVCHATMDYPFVKFTIWNDRMTEITGYTIEEINRLGWHQTLYPDPELQAKAVERMKKMREGANLQAEEWEITRADGSKRVLNISSSIVESDNGLTHVLALTQDITERKRTEEALRQSERNYREIFNSANDAMFIHDVDTGAIIDVSDSMLNLYGYNREEALLLSPQDVSLGVSPFSAVEAKRWIAKTVEEGPQVFEWYARKKSGELFWAEVSLKSSYIGGQPRLLAVVRDITDRKRAEEGLKEAENRYRTLFEGANDATFIVNPDGFLTECNRTTLKIYGCDQLADIIGRTPWDFSLPRQPDGRDSKEKALELINTAVEGKPQRFYWQHVRKDRTTFDAEVSLNRLMLGNKVFVQAFVQDITAHRQAIEALRKSEEKYRGIFDQSVAAIFAFDNKKKFIDSNQAGLDLLGYSREELLHMSIPDVDADAADISSAHQQLFSVGQLVNYEHKLRRKDGTIITVLNNSRPVTDLHGNVIGMLSTLIDITERKLAEEILRATLKEKEVLLREIHHRVKNNMQVVSSLLALQAEMENEQLKQVLLESQQRIMAMAMIHEQLYSGKNLATIDFSAYLKSIVQHLQGAYGNQDNVRISLELDKVELEIDQAVPCGLIINELITNSFKHAFPKGAKGTIQIRVHLVNGTEVVLEVSDNGVGIPPGLDLCTPSSLGLRLVHGLLRHQLKGGLDVANQGGTAFTIRWPLTAGEGASV